MAFDGSQCGTHVFRRDFDEEAAEELRFVDHNHGANSVVQGVEIEVFYYPDDRPALKIDRRIAPAEGLANGFFRALPSDGGYGRFVQYISTFGAVYLGTRAKWWL